jgi:hypothetical protein
MREAHLTRARSATPADQPGVRRGVVRRPERALGHDPLGGKPSGHTPHRGHLERLGEGEGRQDGGQPPGEHRLPVPGGPTISTLGRRRRRSRAPLGVRLPAHVREVHVVHPGARQQLGWVHADGVDGPLAVEEGRGPASDAAG